MTLIALDLDGTLEDSRADMVSAVQRTRTGLGLSQRSYDQIVGHVHRGMPHLYAHCFDDLLAKNADKLSTVMGQYEANYLAHLADETQVYGGIIEVLPKLATIGTLAVVTNKPERISRALLDALGLSSWFGTVIGGDSAPQCKPDPMMLRLAHDRLNIAGSTVMIGDSQGDAKLAHRFGAQSVWCAWGYWPNAPTDPAAHAIAEQPSDLVNIVGSLLG